MPVLYAIYAIQENELTNFNDFKLSEQYNFASSPKVSHQNLAKRCFQV